MSSFFYSIKNIILILIIFIILICVFFIPFISNANLVNTEKLIGESITLNPEGFIWPAPGYTKINCPFGKRVAPTTGASTYHKGIDIGAPEGSYIVAVCDGEITFTDFWGGGGYTITLQVNNMKITYCHLNPNFMVKVGDIVKQGQVIGQVGPKNVYGVKGNNYKDQNGKPTNGATTGPHLHFGIRVDEQYKNPLDYY